MFHLLQGVTFILATLSIGATALSFRGIVSASTNPNSMTAEFAEITAGGVIKRKAFYSGVGGILTNEFATSPGNLAHFVSINISTVKNYFYTVSAETGALHGSRLELPNLLPSVESDTKSKKIYGTTLVGATFHLAELHSGKFASTLTIGDGLEQTPGFSSFCPVSQVYFAMFSGKEGALLYSIDTQNRTVLSKPAVYGGAQASSFEWDYAEMKMYMVSNTGYDAGAVYEIDHSTGKIVRVVCDLKGYPAASGASTFDTATSTYYADLQDLKGRDYLVSCNTKTGAVTGYALEKPIIDLHVVGKD